MLSSITTYAHFDKDVVAVWMFEEGDGALGFLPQSSNAVRKVKRCRFACILIYTIFYRR